MHYVYLLQSTLFPDQKYIGQTSDLKRRLKEHNQGQVLSTKAYLPWELVCYLGFKNRLQAKRFENYLKSGSGQAFARKRFWVGEADTSD